MIEKKVRKPEWSESKDVYETLEWAQRYPGLWSVARFDPEYDRSWLLVGKDVLGDLIAWDYLNNETVDYLDTLDGELSENVQFLLLRDPEGWTLEELLESLPPIGD